MAERVGRIAHRYGDLASGRLDDDFNLYAYVGNDPLNGVDPSGLAGETCGSRLGNAANCGTSAFLDEWEKRQKSDDCSGGVCVNQSTQMASAQTFDQSTPDGIIRQQMANVGAGAWNAVVSTFKKFANLSILGLGGAEVEGGAAVLKGAEGLAQNIANGSRLAQQLRVEQFASQFTATGTLTAETIQRSTLIMDASRLANPAIPAGFAKFTTAPVPSPFSFGGFLTTRFYMNPQTGEVLYGLDYKTLLLP